MLILFRLFFSFSFLSLSLRSSVSLALNGLGPFSLIGLITTDGEVDWTGSGVSLALNVTVPLGVTDEGLMLDVEMGMLELLKTELLNLLWPLLSKLALESSLELGSKSGVLRAELAGVAISVGFTLFLVLVATVVDTFLLGLIKLPNCVIKILY